MLTGNKGEWSEFYAFLKLLAEKRVYGADSDLVVIQEQLYPVLQIFRKESNSSELVYDLSIEPNLIIISNSNESLVSIPVSEISTKLESIFERIKESSNTFTIPIVDELMQKLLCSQIKTASNQKSDLNVVIHDLQTGMKPKVGFSVKSMIGGSATLLNASRATNFIYKIEGLYGDYEEINSIDTRSKVRDRLNMIEARGGKLNYVGLESPIFLRNLRKTDTIFPEILSEMLKHYYKGSCKYTRELVEKIADENIVSEKHQLYREDIEYKLKNFLENVALGLTPNHEWNGISQVQGGYLIVKTDGEVVCYHLYNHELFKNYLYNKTFFDTPSTTKHKFGKIYPTEEGLFINLNLQIRFSQ